MDNFSETGSGHFLNIAKYCFQLDYIEQYLKFSTISLIYIIIIGIPHRTHFFKFMLLSFIFFNSVESYIKTYFTYTN